jgi:hypothetical protein
MKEEKKSILTKMKENVAEEIRTFNPFLFCIRVGAGILTYELYFRNQG